MAVTYNSNDSSNNYDDASPVAVSINGPSGLVNGCMVAIITSEDRSSSDFGGATYNGVSMVKIESFEFFDSPEYSNIGVYYMVNPPDGTNTLSLTFTGASELASASFISVFLEGVNQTDPLGYWSKVDAGSSATPGDGSFVSESSASIIILGLTSNIASNTYSANTGTLVVNHSADHSTGVQYQVATGTTEAVTMGMAPVYLTGGYAAEFLPEVVTFTPSMIIF